MDLFLFVLGVLATVGVVYLLALWVDRNRLPLTILLASTICSRAAEPILPPSPSFAPLPRTFTVTAYTHDGLESAPSQPLVITNRFPITLTFDPAPGQEEDGFRIYMRVLNRTNVYDLGTNTTWTLNPTNPPAVPLNLRLVVPEQKVRLGAPTSPQKFYRTVVQSSTNLSDWENFSGLKTEIERAGL